MFIGANDCTIMGCMIAAATDMIMFEGNHRLNKTVSQYFSFSFHNWNMESKEDDPMVHFRKRLNQKGGLKGVLDSRTGRISDRSKWTVHTINHQDPANRLRIAN